jgi:alkanesulfonate monooxygenase
MDPALIDAAQQLLNKSESVGQQRMLSLHQGNREDLEVSPNLWAGIGLVRPGAGTALVGSHEQVAERIFEYHELGLDEFILSGHPHLEEAYAVGEGVLPRVNRATDGPVRPSEPRGAGHGTLAPAPAG